MKKTFLKVSLCAIIASLAVTACKKKDDPSIKDRMVGSWKLHQLVKDGNNNGTLETTDTTYTFDTLNFIITFKNDGTGTQSQAGVPSGAFTWSVNGIYIVTTDTAAGSTPDALKIISGPSTTLTVSDTSAHPVEFTVLNKQ